MQPFQTRILAACGAVILAAGIAYWASEPSSGGSEPARDRNGSDLAGVEHRPEPDSVDRTTPERVDLVETRTIADSNSADDPTTVALRSDLRDEFGDQVSTDLQRKMLEQLDRARPDRSDGSTASGPGETYLTPSTLTVDHWISQYADGRSISLLPADQAVMDQAVGRLRAMEPMAFEAKNEQYRAFARAVVERNWEEAPDTSIAIHGRTAWERDSRAQLRSLSERYGTFGTDYVTSSLFNELGAFKLIIYREREPLLFSMTDRITEALLATRRTTREVLSHY